MNKSYYHQIAQTILSKSIDYADAKAGNDHRRIEIVIDSLADALQRFEEQMHNHYGSILKKEIKAGI